MVNYELGSNFLRTKKFPEASFYLSKISKGNPLFIDAQYKLGMIHIVQKNYGQAINHFEAVSDELKKATVSQFTFNLSNFQFNFGLCHFREQNYAQAINHFIQMPNDHASYIDAQYHLGVCHFFIGNYEQAFEYLTQIPEGHAKFPGAQTKLKELKESLTKALEEMFKN